jgi:hypothetical protein
MEIQKKCPGCGLTVDEQVAGGLCPACLLRQAFDPVATQANAAAPHSPTWIPPSASSIAEAFHYLDTIELIGQGGMGAVYKVRQKALDRFVALKILAPRFAEDPDFATRFTREARLLGGFPIPTSSPYMTSAKQPASTFC